MDSLNASDGLRATVGLFFLFFFFAFVFSVDCLVFELGSAFVVDSGETLGSLTFLPKEKVLNKKNVQKMVKFSSNIRFLL